MSETCELGLLAGCSQLLPRYAWAELAKISNSDSKSVNLNIARTRFDLNGRSGSAVTVNGSLPAPLLRFREGQEAVIRVTNTLEENSSIHWHGILLPPHMDGVPGVSFAGIKPGETFTYKFPVKQSGTYWYHSHSGGQELEGLYGPLIIDPAGPDPIHFDREYVIVLSDFSFMNPMKIIGKLKKQSSYFNYQKRTLSEFVSDAKKNGVKSTFSERMDWQKMRMDATDISDVTGATYTYLMNGNSPKSNWTALFKKGERIRLRFIAAGAMTIFDVRIPGLKMSVVQADGQNIKPVTVEEFRIAPGETYDVVIELQEEKPYAIFAETIDRSGYALGTLANKEGQRAEVPERRSRPVRTMDDMGMAMGAMSADAMSSGNNKKMPGMDMAAKSPQIESSSMDHHHGHNMQMEPASPARSPIPGAIPVKHGPDNHGVENSAVPDETKSRLHEPGTGLEGSLRKVLVYTDLQALHPYDDQRNPSREIELHLTGNMERYMWSIDGKKYSEAKEPIAFNYGERLRITFVNDTMMEHPMHLHGMWMHLENGAGANLPRKHTVIVKPAERLSVAVTADALGEWALHCHMLIHMEMGMFRVVRVTKKAPEVSS